MDIPHIHLRGSCSCGRNQYTVNVPADIPPREALRVLWDSGNSEHRRMKAHPHTPFLRVPLSAYSSATYAFFPDETHASIKRFFDAPPFSPSSALSGVEKRQFCGYCGTPLTYWRESPREEAEFICLTLGSLDGRDISVLEDLGVLPSSDSESEEEDNLEKMMLGRFSGGWFDHMIRGSRLFRAVGRPGRLIQPRAPQTQKIRVEWEVVEYHGDEDSSGGAAGKRKISEVDDATSKPADHGTSTTAEQQDTHDVEMRGGR